MVKYNKMRKTLFIFIQNTFLYNVWIYRISTSNDFWISTFGEYTVVAKILDITDYY